MFEDILELVVQFIGFLVENLFKRLWRGVQYLRVHLFGADKKILQQKKDNADENSEK